MAKKGLRANDKAKGWVRKKIGYLREEGYKPKQAVAIALSEARKYGLLKNPEEEMDLQDSLSDVEGMVEGFHGRPPKETIDITENKVYRDTLGVLGDLIEMEIYNENRPSLLVLTFTRKKEKDIVKVCASGDRRQMFLVGGNTGVDDETLEGWNIVSNEDGLRKDKIPIGSIVSISYWSDKHHLEGSTGDDEYIHEFGEQSYPKKGKHLLEVEILERLEGGCLPTLVYDRLNGTMGMVGGIYEVRDEGIWD